ncbi:AraC family transcriptional regulator [Rhizobium subbaraonis]|uniref:AraC family transcriptional regulator n=1 Tax=Rhizobium subbaraonis TaxID=908946 RepID=A0A285U4X5_9HYPH|nr:AraC family transcriptional regulator [Rhizobium subbaraonis]SOC36763.1 AraC family transcriptional regulator [Rhizobium subbaraonis]
MPDSPTRSSITVSGIEITRLRYDGDDLAPLPASDRQEAFSAIVQLADFRRHRLWRDGVLVHDGGHERGALAVTDLRRSWRCHHLSPFDNIRFHLPFAQLRDFAAEAGRLEYSGLESVSGKKDGVVLGIAQALLPALERPQDAGQLFLEHIGMALLTHLTQRYGGVHFPPRKKGTLAAWQEKRATELLAGRANGQVSIAELAQACDLSRSYFIKAFRETFGKTPYRWLTEYRVARARDLLKSDMPIAEVAAACGFADQSHLTRVFSEMIGETPGNWRRRGRAG